MSLTRICAEGLYAAVLPLKSCNHLGQHETPRDEPLLPETSAEPCAMHGQTGSICEALLQKTLYVFPFSPNDRVMTGMSGCGSYCIPANGARLLTLQNSIMFTPRGPNA